MDISCVLAVQEVTQHVQLALEMLKAVSDCTSDNNSKQISWTGLNRYNLDEEDDKSVQVRVHMIVNNYMMCYMTCQTHLAFFSYAYSGNPQFDLFKGGPWQNEVLEQTDNFYAFRDELLLESETVVGIRDPPIDYELFFTPKCRQVEGEL